MKETILAYMLDAEKTRSKATVVRIETGAPGEPVCVILDETIFYPQGGGQPYDTGTMTSPNGVFAVAEVRFVDGFVRHLGTFTSGAFQEGAVVDCSIDEARRVLNSRLHSAGHLLDESVRNVGLPWIPTKGIHFPGQTAVEYSGTVDDPEAARAAIEAEANRLIAAGCAIRTDMVSLDKLAACSDFVPANLPENKPIRVVTISREKGTPCGGTHVGNVSEIGPLKVRYVKAKKGTIKVAYEINEA